MNSRKMPDRREFLYSAMGFGLGFVASAEGDVGEKQIYRIDYKVLDETDKIDIGGRGAAIIEKAYATGYRLEKEHGGCARCTVAAIQECIEFIPKDAGLFRATSCLNGGATPTKEANCGAFTGSGMIIGWTCGEETLEKKSPLTKKLMDEVFRKFEAEYGSVLCKHVREKANGDCNNVVGKASRWLAEILLRQFTNYTGENTRE